MNETIQGPYIADKVLAERMKYFDPNPKNFKSLYIDKPLELLTKEQLIFVIDEQFRMHELYVKSRSLLNVEL